MNNPNEEQNSHCKQCKHRIPTGAMLCSTCNSYQDWRGFLTISGSALAVITSLVAIIGVAIPPLYKIFHTPRSEAAITMPSFDGTTFRVIALNKGDAAASLGRAWIESELLAGATKVRLRNASDALIQPGSKLVTFDIIPLMDESNSYGHSIQMLGFTRGDKPAPRTEIRVEILQSDGTSLIQVTPMNAGDLFHLFRANADRCSAVENPDFENGCIGNGEVQ